jgi:hypothetical protein
MGGMRPWFIVVASAVVVILAGACHSAPVDLSRPEAGATPRASAGAATPEASVADASAPAASSTPAESASAAAAPADAGEPDGGLHAALHDFCNGAFSADDDRMRVKCSPSDLGLRERMGRSAADVCTRDMLAALRRSHADFDAEAGKKCVDMLHQRQLAQTSESDTPFQHFPCDRVVVGMQPEEQPCLFSVECKDGLACVGHRNGVEGTCKKPPHAKEACSLQPYGSILNEAAAALHHPACAAGATCDGAICQPRLPAGKACTKPEVCAAGLSCVMGKCGPRARTGSACAAARDCAFGLWCDRGADGGAGKCAPKRTEGQACTSRDACKGRCDMSPKPGVRPTASGRCAAVCGSG